VNIDTIHCQGFPAVTETWYLSWLHTGEKKIRQTIAPHFPLPRLDEVLPSQAAWGMISCLSPLHPYVFLGSFLLSKVACVPQESADTSHLQENYVQEALPSCRHTNPNDLTDLKIFLNPL
jgi:hypothetical protein